METEPSNWSLRRSLRLVPHRAKYSQMLVRKMSLFFWVRFVPLQPRAASQSNSTPEHGINSHSTSGSFFRFLQAACFLVLLGSWSMLNAQCPVADRSSWRQGRDVTFHIDPNMSEAEQQQIRRAIDKWNAANQANGSGVNFVERFNPMQIPAALNFENGIIPVTNPDRTTSYASGLTSPPTGSDGTLNSATITIDPNRELALIQLLEPPALILSLRRSRFTKLGIPWG